MKLKNKKRNIKQIIMEIKKNKITCEFHKGDGVLVKIKDLL